MQAHFAVGDHDPSKRQVVFRNFNSYILKHYARKQKSIPRDRRLDPLKLYDTEIVPVKERSAPEPLKAGIEKRVVMGNPDLAYVSTSYVERHNRTIRMRNRRFTRKTDAFSKTVPNHRHMSALYVVFYNFVCIHKTLRVSPAMAAGISDRLWSAEDIVALIDARAGPPMKRGPYKSRRQRPRISN